MIEADQKARYMRMKTVDLSGIWECSIPEQSGEICLPGTLDEAGFGFPDDPARQWQAEDVKRIGFWQEDDPIVTRRPRRRFTKVRPGSAGNFHGTAPPAAAFSGM